MAVGLDTRLVLLDPTYESERSSGQMAARPAATAGLTLGLLDNSKPHSRELLDVVESLVHERLAPGRVLRFQKPDATRPAPPELIDDIAGQCQLVINGVGD